MAIARDAQTSIAFDTATTFTQAHTITGSNTGLVVTLRSGNATDTITGVTWNGTSMTRIEYQQQAGNNGVYIYYLQAAATGTHNVVVSLSANTFGMDGSIQSYTGTDQTTLVDTHTGNNTNAQDSTLSFTTSNAGCWGIAIHAEIQHGSGLANSTNENHDLWRPNGAGSAPVAVDTNGSLGAAGSYSMVQTGSNSNDKWASAMVAIFPSAATGPANLKTWDNIAAASVKTYGALASASVKTWDGVA